MEADLPATGWMVP